MLYASQNIVLLFKYVLRAHSQRHFIVLGEFCIDKKIGNKNVCCLIYSKYETKVRGEGGKFDINVYHF